MARKPKPARRRVRGSRRWGTTDSGFASLRDVLVFLAGLGVLVKAVWFSSPVNLELVLVAAGMMGLPLATTADERRQQRRDRQDSGDRR